MINFNLEKEPNGSAPHQHVATDYLADDQALGRLGLHPLGAVHHQHHQVDYLVQDHDWLEQSGSDVPGPPL